MQICRAEFFEFYPEREAFFPKKAPPLWGEPGRGGGGGSVAFVRTKVIAEPVEVLPPEMTSAIGQEHLRTLRRRADALLVE